MSQWHLFFIFAIILHGRYQKWPENVSSRKHWELNEWLFCDYMVVKHSQNSHFRTIMTVLGSVRGSFRLNLVTGPDHPGCCSWFVTKGYSQVIRITAKYRRSRDFMLKNDKVHHISRQNTGTAVILYWKRGYSFPPVKNHDKLSAQRQCIFLIFKTVGNQELTVACMAGGIS